MPAVNLNHEAYDVRIDRRTKLGNKYIIGRDGDRDEVCDKYRTWLWKQIIAGRISLEELAKLKGLKLGCHCAPLRCHGDTLAAAADWAHAELARRRSV